MNARSAELRISDQLALPLDAVTETFAILAKRGAGKSNAAVVLAEAMFDAGLPWVAVDPKGDWWGVRSSSAGTGPGLPVLVFGGRHADVPLEATAGRLVADLIVDERLTVVLDVSLMSKADMRRFLADFAERLYQRNTDPLHVFAEEAHEYIPQRVDAGAARMVGAWEKLVKWGRTSGLGVTLITQRSASLNKDVLTQVETLIALRTTGPQDQAAIRAWVDQHDTGAAMIAEVRKLPNGDAFVLSPQWLDLDEPRRITFHRRRTFDSGATPKAGETRAVPRTLADVDLAAIKEAMAETIEKAQADDPKVLRGRIRDLERDLAAARAATPEPVIERVPVLTLDVEEMTTLSARVLDFAGLLREALSHPDLGARSIEAMAARSRRDDVAVAVSDQAGAARFSLPQLPSPPRGPVPQPTPKRRNTSLPADAPMLRAGARRMVEALGRMAPLRLTKAQWGTVAKLKTTGGTWSTYIGEIRRLGFIDETSAGYTLTDAGFDYLGGRPAPMTAGELQDHYRGILRAGARTMFNVLLDAHPDGLTKEQLGAAAEISTAGGTFSTYVGDLTRNGLAERRDGLIFATDLLVYGAEATHA